MKIPDKLYFKIGEVAHLAGLEAYVLRYWETEFREIAPVKSRHNQRLYRRRDVEKVLMIKNLLYNEGYTLSGAKKKLRELSRNGGRNRPEQMVISFSEHHKKDHQVLVQARHALEEMLKMLG